MSLPDSVHLHLNAYQTGLLHGWLMKIKSENPSAEMDYHVDALIEKIRVAWQEAGNQEMPTPVLGGKRFISL